MKETNDQNLSPGQTIKTTNGDEKPAIVQSAKPAE